MVRKVVLIIAISIILIGLPANPAIAARVEQGYRNVERCTVEQGQIFIDEGRYAHALREFTCLIAANPTEVEGYRGRIEAELLLGLFSDAVSDYARVTALVIPVHPDAETTILAGYSARLVINPLSLPALTGISFAHWYFFSYSAALPYFETLLSIQPDNLYGTLFRGSTQVLLGLPHARGVADLERALELAPDSPHVRWVVADGFFYGRTDYSRALAEATLALDWGLDTPRIHAILASAYLALGDLSSAASHFARHIELVTTEAVLTAPLYPNDSMSVGLVPGRTYEIPIPAVAGETISILASSHDIYDTIVVLLDPTGIPVMGGDDYKGYFAGFQYGAQVTGTYLLRATSFEAINTGDMLVRRK